MSNIRLHHPASDATTKLIAEVFLKPALPELVLEEKSELSLQLSNDSPILLEPSQIWNTLANKLGSQSASLSLLGITENENKEALGWFKSLQSFQAKKTEVLKQFESHLQSRTYMVGKDLTGTDLAVFTTLHSYIKSAVQSDLTGHPSITRHFDFIQNHPSVKSAIQKTNLGELSTISINLDDVPLIERTQAAPVKKEKKEPKAEASASTPGTKKATAPQSTEPSSTPVVGESGKPSKKKAEKEKKKDDKEGKKAGGASATVVDGPPMPHMIDMRVGKIVHVEKHPDADSLYVEKIDFGEPETRTVVSGLVNYIPIEEMRDRLLVGICNLKPANMRGVKSFAMVLAATSKDGKGGAGSVELVAPPPGSQPGDRVFFEGFENEKPIEQLNPKKKQFEVIQPNFTTLETKEACWKDPNNDGKPHRIMTERGVCVAPNFVGASLS
ncbi:hypothetical protein CROQUDRAFT_657357 [Cronartium quercuum f. sp. fusiforme G11]|uniref:tRNA-binding domain-containing protein n=1 Tax=Cronartium quercuum f. sp. fusiforme G11 TaxID=708437 RepID=A0A9P6NMW8_9BASI|nr:hypothetical protein CROQUDRAFT_657357 [Cronartium quercuum f. sp. fusiforme G11]